MAPPFLDTNILIYAVSRDQRADIARLILRRPFVISVQALNEMANTCLRKLKMNSDETRDAVAQIRTLATSIVDVDIDLHIRALDVHERWKFSFYDSLMLSAALRSGCVEFLSEDMQHGLVVDEDLTIRNPFQ